MHVGNIRSIAVWEFECVGLICRFLETLRTQARSRACGKGGGIAVRGTMIGESARLVLRRRLMGSFRSLSCCTILFCGSHSSSTFGKAWARGVEGSRMSGKAFERGVEGVSSGVCFP